LIAEVTERGSLAAVRPVRSPLLRDYSVRFLEWVQAARLEPNTKRYYERGWKLISTTKLAAMQISRITADDVEATHFHRTLEKEGEKPTTIECSAQYTNQGLRTLRRMFSKAIEWRLMKDGPRFKLMKAHGRNVKIDPATERLLVADLSAPITNGRSARMRSQLKDILVIAQDTGLRPSELFRLRVENLDFTHRRVWNPFGKTAKATRFVPMSHRMAALLIIRCENRKEGWVFPSNRSKSGHIETIARGFQALRRRTGISEKIVPYSARHTYGSYTVEATGNIFAVASSMGHVDIKSMEPYQHHEIDSLREAIDRRNQANMQN